ncbi:MAG TPA: M55 family metallopeptidase, partial [Candidatus Tumulicola sp.]|nr:M55 family metallopeptidase [Candidatus Tumulicola sp.]
MKLYISSDMEGVAGVCGWEQVDARTPHPEYAIYRRYYTQEVESAIRGARAAGAGEVLVNDSHGPMRNLLFDELPHDVRVLFGNRKPFSMVQDADASFGGAFFIGYHGGAGEADAVLCHTYTPSVIYEVRVNGIRCSEATLNAGLLGSYGVPLLLITGDRTTVEGVRHQMP